MDQGGTALLDWLVVGPHPDDAEIGLGGTMARLAAHQLRVGILDLSRGERATNGTPEVRRAEAERAAAALGVAVREQLRLPDGGIGLDREQLGPVVAALRRLRPKVLAVPLPDRHPDHGRAGALLDEAVFLAGLASYEVASTSAEPPEAPHRVERVVRYPIHAQPAPSLLVDVSSHYDRKMTALMAYQSQFGAGGAPTPLNQGYIQALSVRDAAWGALGGVRWAEAVVLDRPPLLADPTRF